MNKINSTRIMAYSLFIYLLLTPLNFIGFIPGLSFTRILVILPLSISLLNIKNMRIRLDYYTILPILYILVLMFSIVYSVEASSSIARTFSVSQNILAILLFSFVKYNKRDIEIITNGLVLSGWFTILLLIFFAEPLGNTLRMSIVIGGVSQDPNDLIGYLFFTIIYYFAFFTSGKKILNLVLLVPFIIVILLTGSRGGLLAVLISMMTYLAITTKSLKKFAFNTIFAILVLFVFLNIANILIPTEILERYTFDFIFNDQGAGRFTIWDSILIHWKNSPFSRQLFGWGSGTIRLFTYRNTVAHNLWFEALIEIGFFGTCVLFLFFFTYLKKAYKDNFYVLFSVLIGLIVMTLSLSLYSYKPIWNTFLMILIITRYNQKIIDNERLTI